MLLNSANIRCPWRWGRDDAATGKNKTEPQWGPHCVICKTEYYAAVKTKGPQVQAQLSNQNDVQPKKQVTEPQADKLHLCTIYKNRQH